MVLIVTGLVLLLAASVDALSRRRVRSMVSRAVGHTRVVRSVLGGEAQLVGAAELAFGPVLARRPARRPPSSKLCIRRTRDVYFMP